MTVFKKKSCIKCKSNHDNDGNLCDFCLAEAERALNNRPPTPDSYWLECLIERDGDTSTNMNGVPYVFRKNKFGKAVCEVVNLGHYNAFLKMPHLYAAYTWPEAPEPVEPKAIETPVEGRNRMELIFSMQPPTVAVTEIERPRVVTVEIPSVHETILSLAAEGKTDTEIAEQIGNGLTRQRVTKLRTEALNASNATANNHH